ncbi:MAG: TM2 domain-containing protein [Bacilli bacterium]|nr:TM2 domain-containing protein [Bacilli bacterium]
MLSKENTCMAKIIEINEDVVSIGEDSGGIKEVRISDLNFIPVLGDAVEIYSSENKLVITKKETKKLEHEKDLNSGININLSNNQSNNQPNAQPVYIIDNKKVVNKLVYCLLAFFLGGLGIHRLYAGKITSGILFILFFWTFIPAFIALIDFSDCNF